MNRAIVPTVTAITPDDYQAQMELVADLSARLHIDFADGDFAPNTLLAPGESWLPEGFETDIHLMYRWPENELETIMSMKPNLVILHAEAEGNILRLLREIKAMGARAGIALLQNSQPEEFANEIDECEHVLIFGGNLGFHGGEADLSVLDKIARIKEISPLTEIGWDGGANAENTPKLFKAGVNVVNVGGFIHKADDPKKAYAILESMIR